jgi:hypothetical protein
MNATFRGQGFTPAQRVVAQEDHGDGFLLHLDTGQYYSLNRTGMVVWQAIEQGSDPLALLQQRYPEAPADKLDRDIHTVLTQLVDAELVVAHTSAQE